jgi:hypothetical protein
MIWKAIGQSAIGSSHITMNKDCEDAVQYRVINPGTDYETLIGFVSDGAGSAKYAAQASLLAVQIGCSIAESWVLEQKEIDENYFILLAEHVYDEFAALAKKAEVAINEYSCTLLGFVILPGQACFIQIGDGAIVKNNGDGHFTPVWWPHNGEYQNTTVFLIDDPNFRNLKIKILTEQVKEVAVFSDGLQMLALNNETETVHQPFFKDFFKVLRMAHNEDHLSILNAKLDQYLSGSTINNRTDDDKTLLLATKLSHDNAII